MHFTYPVVNNKETSPYVTSLRRSSPIIIFTHAFMWELIRHDPLFVKLFQETELKKIYDVFGCNYDVVLPTITFDPAKSFNTAVSNPLFLHQLSFFKPIPLKPKVEKEKYNKDILYDFNSSYSIGQAELYLTEHYLSQKRDSASRSFRKVTASLQSFPGRRSMVNIYTLLETVGSDIIEKIDFGTAQLLDVSDSYSEEQLAVIERFGRLLHQCRDSHNYRPLYPGFPKKPTSLTDAVNMLCRSVAAVEAQKKIKLVSTPRSLFNEEIRIKPRQEDDFHTVFKWCLDKYNQLLIDLSWKFYKEKYPHIDTGKKTLENFRRRIENQLNRTACCNFASRQGQTSAQERTVINVKPDKKNSVSLTITYRNSEKEFCNILFHHRHISIKYPQWSELPEEKIQFV